MTIEFRAGPKPVTPEYRQSMRDAIASSRVAASGLFDDYGVFRLVPWGRDTSMDEPEYWALNLLRFTYGQDGVWSWHDGTMTVFGGRMEAPPRTKTVDLAKKQPLHTLGPGNVRELEYEGTYGAVVPESGWVLGKEASRFLRIQGLEEDELRRILEDATKGIKPPFFDRHTYTMVNPAYAGKRVRVLPFEGIDDAVVFDVETRKMIPAYHEAILSDRVWH